MATKFRCFNCRIGGRDHFTRSRRTWCRSGHRYYEYTCTSCGHTGWTYKPSAQRFRVVDRTKVRCWRIRQNRGYANGQHHYYHADVIADTWQQALRAAREGRVQTWRWIDSFDRSSETYCYYNYLYQVTDLQWGKYPVSISDEPREDFVDDMRARQRSSVSSRT